MMARVLVALALCALLGSCVASDVGKDMADIVSEKGYPIEEHSVVTEDQVTLGMFRIPFGRNGDGKVGGKPAVLLQHGLLDSSYTWVNNFANESLAFMLADAGYDVWLSNSRGNFYSTPNNPPDSFWSFSFDEMAKYDLPANIEYVLAQTGADSLTYVGHSQGTTQAFAGFSINPKLAEKVNLFVGLAPVAYVHHQSTVLISLLADLDAVVFFELFGIRDFLPDNTLLQKLAPGICSLFSYGCEDFLFLVVGASNNLNVSRIDVYVSETPAGTSTQNMAHWAQGVQSEEFQMYDYGCSFLSCPNLQHYGQRTPPAYNLSAVHVPMALYSGSADTLADPTDVARLLQLLPTNAVIRSKEIPGYAHLDFTWAPDASALVYADFMELIPHFAHTPAPRTQ